MAENESEMKEKEEMDEVGSNDEQTDGELDSAEEKKGRKPKRKGSNVAKLEKDVAQLNEKNDELKDKYIRLFADFDNYKKRVAKEKLELIREGGKEFVLALLPILDDVRRAKKSVDGTENIGAVKEGLELIHDKLFKGLGQMGVKEMECIGKDFDPEFHEAITEIPAPSKKEIGKILDVVENGYYLREQIIRYPKVVVGK